jgi:hypothetical protein
MSRSVFLKLPDIQLVVPLFTSCSQLVSAKLPPLHHAAHASHHIRKNVGIAAHAALGNLLTELKSIVPVVAGGTTSEPRPGKSMVVR